MWSIGFWPSCTDFSIFHGVLRTILAPHIQKPFLMDMKRIGRILLVVLYCVVTVGMTVSTHFCGPVPVTSHLGASTAEPDWCCGDAEKEVECCTTISVTLVVSDDHAASTHETSSPGAATTILPAQDVRSGNPCFARLHQPAGYPPGTSPPLTILNSCFLI